MVNALAHRHAEIFQRLLRDVDHRPPSAMLARLRPRRYKRRVRKDYDHLPRTTQRQLEQVVQILREQFAEAIKGKDWERRKQGRIVKIILYGSFARGGWVWDRSSGYKSDFDLLVVVSHEALTDPGWWYGAEDVLALWEKGGASRPEANFLVHSLQDVNDQLRRGRPFFVDIARDGIILHEFDPKELARPGNLSEAEKREEARGYFEQWWENTTKLKKGADFYKSEGDLKQAAFMLHQAVEAAYHCLLLTLTLYSPKLHKINVLRAMAEDIAPGLIEAWPRKTRPDRRPFDRIRRAYVEARYSKHYRITAEELAAATASVERMQAIIQSICCEKIHANFKSS